MGWGSEITTLEAVPAQAGDGWRIFIQWASGRIQYISGFESVQDAENWIANEAQNWLRALKSARSLLPFLLPFGLRSRASFCTRARNA